MRCAWPWPDNDAAEVAKLYAIACREVGPLVILAAAQAWVAAADAPRFLPKLSVWLAGRGWEKPPPQKKPARQAGRGNGAHRGGYRNGDKPDMARMMLALAGEA